MHKLGVVVPYRNRDKQLRTFLEKVPKYLDRKGLLYEIIVVEQMDEEDFNRGALLNAGACVAEKLGCDYLAFHDVDLLPEDVDYYYPKNGPVELVGQIQDSTLDRHFSVALQTPEFDYFGGATLITLEDFKKINGYSNRYTGWGFEDSDLLARCEEAGLHLSVRKFRQLQITTPSLYFNGKDSYVEIGMGTVPNLMKNFSILVDFKVEALPYREKEISDEATIFSIPGLDCNLSYTNYGTLKFEVFDNYEECYPVHTEKIPEGITSQAVITFGGGTFKFYLNGALVGTRTVFDDRKFKLYSDTVYLGVSDLNRGDKAHWFQGNISEIAFFKQSFNPKEVRELFEKSSLGLGSYNPENWFLASTLREDYLPNLGTGKYNCYYVHNCFVEPLNTPNAFQNVFVPQNRKGIFTTQAHISNGYREGTWKSWSTRLNQKKYLETLQLGSRKHLDGLSTLEKIGKFRVVPGNEGYVHVDMFFSLKK